MEHKTDSSIPEELKVRYSNFRRLGAGAMGAVYRAHDANLDKDVAIKLLKQRQIAPELAIRFQQEAKVASKLKHPNLVTLMDFGISEKGEPYIIMESVEGKSLGSILEKQRTVPIVAAVNIMLQICDGMEHAHRNNVVHRDLKPSNVIVTGDDMVTATIKVLDFGIAKLDDSTTGNITRTGTILGTPYYMSPEQFSGENVDKRTDVYAAGSMLFRMLTDCHPFEGDTMIEIMQEKRSKCAPLMAEVTDLEIPEHFEEVVARCLEPEPEDRYQSMSELREALWNALERTKEAAAAQQKELADLDKLAAKPSAKRQPAYPCAIAALLATVIAILTWYAATVLLAPQKAAPESDVSNTGVDIGLSAKTMACSFTVDTNTHSWTARGLVQDRDLQKLVAEKDRNDIKSLIIGDTQDLGTRQDSITSRGWAYVAKIPISRLVAPYSSIDDKGIEAVSGIPSLTDLDVSCSRVTDAGIHFLKSKNSLQYLMLSGCRISNAGCKSIQAIESLTQLGLSGTDVTNQGLIEIAKMKNLRQLHLDGTKANDEGMKAIARMPSLQHLWLAHSKIGYEGYKNLAGLKLVQLSVEGNRKFDDRCLSLVIKQWPNIQNLNLSETAVTPEGLKSLPRLNNLTSVSVCSLGLTDDDMDAVLKIPNLGILHCIFNRITDKTIDKFANMPNLRYADVLECSSVSQNAINRVREKRAAKNFEKLDIKSIDKSGRDNAQSLGKELFGNSEY